MLGRIMGRFTSIALFATALISFSSAVLLLLNGFIEYLQNGAWHSVSLLQLGYDSHLIKARWFLAHEWSWWLHDLLQFVPVHAALILLAPLAWWISISIDRR